MADEQTPAGTPEGTEEPQPGGQGAGKEPAGAPAGGFTQEQVDDIVRKRLERERGKFADYDELKKAADELKKLRTAQMSEQEKATARATELEQKLADAETSATEFRLSIAERLIRAEVASVARDLGFADPDDAWRLADLAGVTVNDELNVDKAAVKKALETLAKGKAYLLTSASAPKPGTPPRGKASGVQPVAPGEKETWTRF